MPGALATPVSPAFHLEPKDAHVFVGYATTAGKIASADPLFIKVVYKFSPYIISQFTRTTV